MKKLLLKTLFSLFLLSSFVLYSFGQAPEVKWAKEFPPDPEQNASYSAHDILEVEGGFIICGDKKIQVGTNPGHINTFAMKVDQEGNMLWYEDYSVEIEGEYQPDEVANSIVQTNSGNFYIVGYHSHRPNDSYTPPRPMTDLLIMEIDTDGTFVRKVFANGTGSLDQVDGTNIHKAIDNTYIITGMCRDWEGESRDHIFLAELIDNNLEPWFLKPIDYIIDGELKTTRGTWANKLSDTEYVLLGNIQLDELQSFLMGANSTIYPTWKHIYDGETPIVMTDIITEDDNYYLTGYKTVQIPDGIFNYFYPQIYVTKVGNEGEIDWEFNYEDAGIYYPSSIHKAPDGNLIVTGTHVFRSPSANYIFLTKIDSETGTLIWMEEYNVYSASGNAILTTDFGYFLAGRAIYNSVPSKRLTLIYLDNSETETEVFRHSGLDLGLVTTSENIDVIDGSGLTGNIFGVSVTINELIHPAVESLELFLVHGETSVKLVAPSQASGENFINTTFLDASEYNIYPDGAPYTGSYQPLELLHAFNGESAGGDWTLRIIDYSAVGLKSTSTTGTLNGWTLKLLTDAGSGTGIYTQEDIENFQLYPCYPNPLNEETRIDFKIPKRGHVNLMVYNLSGEVVKKLVDTELNEGEHSRVWNAQDIAAGTYFLHLESNGIISVQKLIVIK